METIIVGRTDADQQFHVRFVASNSERTFWCENLKTRASANRAIARHAETFVGAGNAQVVKVGTESHVYSLRLLGVVVSEIPIEYNDSRTKGS